MKRTIVVVLALVFLAGYGRADAKPGRIVTDPRGFRYVVWPFTFHGLTVGRPFDRLDQIAALGFGDPVEIRAKIEAFLKKHNLTEADLVIYAHYFGPIFKHLNTRKMGPARARQYLGQFFNFLKIKNVDYKRLKADLFVRGGTVIKVMIQGGTPSAPLAADASLQKFTAALGKPDLVLNVKLPPGNALKLPSEVKWYVWRNMICWVNQGQVVRVIIHSGPSHGRVGPRPRDEKSFSCGWIVPWSLVRRLAKRPDLYAKLRRAAEAQGVAWRPENDFLIEAIRRQMTYSIADGHAWDLKKTFPGEIGLLFNEPCHRGLDPLLPYLFPGLKIDPQKFKIRFCSADFRPPAMVTGVVIDFERPGSLTRAEFERIFGSPDKVITQKFRRGTVHSLFYLKKHIIAFFRGGRLQHVFFPSGPIIFPPPR